RGQNTGSVVVPKVINIIMPKSNRCSSIPKYPRVETIQEQELEGENNGLPPIGRKETRKAERFRRIHEKRYESDIA
ncbi:2813_t:CDS:2, partial [Rhizophagus irregularis]